MEWRGRGFRNTKGPRLRASTGFSSLEMQELGGSSLAGRDKGESPWPLGSSDTSSSSPAQSDRGSFQGARGQAQGSDCGEGLGRSPGEGHGRGQGQRGQGGGQGEGRGRGEGRGGRDRGEGEGQEGGRVEGRGGRDKGRGGGRGEGRGGRGRGEGEGQRGGRDRDKGQGGGEGRGERRGGGHSEGYGRGHGQANTRPGNLGYGDNRCSVKNIIGRCGNRAQSEIPSVSCSQRDSWGGQSGYHDRQGDSSSGASLSPLLSTAVSHQSMGVIPGSTRWEVERELLISKKRDLKELAGTKGEPILVKANFFAIEHLSMEKAFHYDVTCNPERPKKLLRSVLEEFKLKHFPGKTIAFDGKKNIYTMTPLAYAEKDMIKGTVNVFNEEKQRDMKFQVTLKLVAYVDLSKINQKCIQVLEVVLGAAAALKYTSVGRSFFSFNDRAIPITDGLEVRCGLHLSVKQGRQLYVNVNTVHKAFLRPQSVVDLIKELCATSHMNFNQPLQKGVICKLKDMLRGSKVKYSLVKDDISINRTKRVHDVSRTPSELKFNFNGEDITVENYFRHEKKVSLKYRHFPCLNLGSSARTEFVPVEFCTIVKGQVMQHNLSGSQTAAIIDQSATNTIVRANNIKDGVKYLDLNNSSQVKGFGIRINPEFEEINARILKSPKLKYQTSQSSPINGEWYPESPFLQGSSLDKWTVIILDECVAHSEVYTFTNQLEKQGKEMDVIIKKPYPFKSVNTKSHYDLESLFNDIFSEYKDFDLIFIVGFKITKTYYSIKRAAELKVGLLTQYLTNSVLRRKKNLIGIIHNVLQKVNAKLGGINHVLSNNIVPSKFSNSAVMYVGADVTHPIPGAEGTPSVAAVCASHDTSGFQYKAQICVQPSKEEIIVDMEEIMIQHLRYYEEKMNKKPDIIVFFRDGVGEGQFSEVLAKELQALRRACASLDLKYEPKITFIIVQKRHHARFFPVKPVQTKNTNVPSGTIVDKVVTKPKNQEFYLISHASPRGVSRPCRYHCLWDDNNLNADELQELVYSQCFTYSRCERSVSYPVPTYYAHHAATRGKVYLGENCRNWSNQYLKEHSHIIYKLPPMYFI